MDNSSIILARWEGNNLNGPYVYINDKLRAFGTFLNNSLDGYNVLTSTVEPYKTIYSLFRNDKPYGSAVVIDGQEVMLCRYINGELE